MRKLISIILVFLFYAGYSQEKQDTTTYKFLDIMGLTKAFKTTMSAKSTQDINVFLDFGNNEVYSPDEPYIDNISKAPMIFNSIVDALNYFSKKGWKVESVFVIEQAAGSSFERHITHCLMKKALY